jgi:hypothetical protein
MVLFNTHIAEGFNAGHNTKEHLLCQTRLGCCLVVLIDVEELQPFHSRLQVPGTSPGIAPVGYVMIAEIV